MASKAEDGFAFQGIPEAIYTDNGPIAKSRIFGRVLECLGVRLMTHVPAGKDGRRTTARSKGKVERPFRTVKEAHETPKVIDHVMVTAGGPYYARLADLDRERAHRDFDEHLWLAVAVAQHAVGRVRPGGSLVFMGGTGGRARGSGLSLMAAATAALPAPIANLAVEVAPVRVNLIAAGFVDTPLSASLLGDQLDARREQLRTTLPIGRVVGPTDIAALAVHLMTNTAVTGATYDIDGGQQLVSRG
jgi:NAD(P)-dependent dehydrogenase (short-subunit alcohol dehydrogenase family)